MQREYRRCTNLVGKIVEIETLRPAFFIVCHHQIGNRSHLRARIVGVAESALGFALRLLSALILTGALLLPLRECCTRASCHWVVVFLDL